MHRILLVIIVALLANSGVFAQNNVGIGTSNPHPKALVDMTATDKGLLVPRMTAAQRLSIISPPSSLLVFDTDSNCFFYWRVLPFPARWVSMCSGGNGAAGVTGQVGPTGQTGLPGVRGATGATGAVGTAGINGTTGITGTTGAIGLNGTTGRTGSTGSTGSMGTTGATGSTGSTGVGINGTTNYGLDSLIIHYTDGRTDTVALAKGSTGFYRFNRSWR